MINNYPHYYLKKFAKDVTVIESDPDNRTFKIDKSLYKSLNDPLLWSNYDPLLTSIHEGEALALADAVPQSSPNKKKIQGIANRIASKFVLRDKLISAIPGAIGLLGGFAAYKALKGPAAIIPAFISTALGFGLSDALRDKLKVDRYNKLRRLVSKEPILDLTNTAYATGEQDPAIHAYNNTLNMLNDYYYKQLKNKNSGYLS